MRVHLELVSLEPQPSIPVNYNHLLSKAILKVLSRAEPEYQAVLRARGLKGQFSKRFKLFTFSSLQFFGPRWTLDGGIFRFEEPSSAKLILSFAHDPEFVKKHFLPLLAEATIPIATNTEKVTFKVDSLECHEFPQLQSGTYKALSPITISRKVKDEIRYLSPRSFETGLALAENLADKYELLTGERIDSHLITIKPDPEYLARAPHPMKVFNVDEGNQVISRVRAFLAPVQIGGDQRLIRLAFACGLGERNSLGFGLLAPPSNRRHRTLRRA